MTGSGGQPVRVATPDSTLGTVTINQERPAFTASELVSELNPQ